ncbi:MAG: DUF2309 domain-containing protein [Pseudomonadota bacterium]
MSLELGMQAQIRSMVFVAGEPIPYFWPMRAFIHHNPLHGLEQLPFEDAVAEGRRLFHGAGFLPPSVYRGMLEQGKIDALTLAEGVRSFLDAREPLAGIDLHAWMLQLLTSSEVDLSTDGSLATVAAVGAALRRESVPAGPEPDAGPLAEHGCDEMLGGRSIYEALDLLFGSGIGEELDELVIKSCLDFFDEGQSVWQMPDRERGFFSAWREVALRNARLFLRGRNMRETLEADADPEGVIVHVMQRLKVPQSQWMQYFRRELSRLHGWAGFIRWRAAARHYYLGRRFPGDLVDFLAVRLTLSLALISERGNDGIPIDAEALEQFIRRHPAETCLRREFFGRTILPAWAQRAEVALLGGDQHRIEELGLAYLREKRARDAAAQAAALERLAGQAGAGGVLQRMDNATLARLLERVQEFHRHEGMIWLEAMEATAMQTLLRGVRRSLPAASDKRPFAQALFCIDTRSERLRRHLESVGDYQTFGIAGFFGVPVSFMELGKGSETHLCPVLLTPKNLVMEMSVSEVQDTVALTAIEKALHELKESVLTPFVTVEAIGLLFGFDMVGKTIAPTAYNRWRSHLHRHKPHTHLLIDKLSLEQADSIVRAVQRAVIAKAVEHEFEVSAEHIRDDMVRELREVALGHAEVAPLLQRELQLDEGGARAFIDRLRTTYRINAADARLQMERLGRIGFSLDEQVNFVSQALHAIGLTGNYSRFILVVGHGSQSENNPYESALDCGACGGNLGLYNARIFASMANKPAVRLRLQEQGIDIPDDAWFIPALHNTTTDEVALHDLTLLPSSHPVYLDRLQKGLVAACRLCTQERVPSLDFISDTPDPERADKRALRNAMDWSQVRPEWGLSRNAYFIIGRRALTEAFSLDGRAFLHSYEYRVDRKLRLLENILTGPLVVGQWINMEHYFSTVDNEHYGSGSKVYHNVAGRFGVMTGNLSDLRTGLPAQTVLAQGQPYHEPMRLITVIEAPFDRVIRAINRVAVVRRLLHNGWIRVMIIDPDSGKIHLYSHGEWQERPVPGDTGTVTHDEAIAS